MAQIETWIDTDLDVLPQVKVLAGKMFSGDSAGNKIGVRVTDDGEPVELSGTVTGKVVTPDGETLTVSGSSSGNRAWIVLPEGCYTHKGRLSVAIKITDGGIVTTLGAMEAYVYPGS